MLRIYFLQQWYGLSDGVWCKFQRRAKNDVFAATSASGKDCPPNGGRSGIFEAQVREIELSFANAMCQFDARDRDGRVPETLEAEHRVDPGLDVAMILLDQVVQLLRGSQRRVLGQ
jgi:hypothetical protein